MTCPRWLKVTIVRAIHADLVRAHGGPPGLRDRGLLESALDRARNLHRYEPDADIFRLAAACGFGIARSHPFLDGNKRVAFQAMYVFLGLNGWRIEADEPDAVAAMRALAAGELDEDGLAGWLRETSTRREPHPRDG